MYVQKRKRDSVAGGSNLEDFGLVQAKFRSCAELILTRIISQYVHDDC